MIPKRIIASDRSGWRLYFEYDKKLTTALAVFPSRKFVTHTEAAERYWHLDACKENAAQIQAFAREQEFKVDEDALNLIKLVQNGNQRPAIEANGQEQERRKYLALHQALNGLENLRINGWKLFNHQIEGIRWMCGQTPLKDRHIAKAGYALLCDDLGLGKTLESLFVAWAFQRALGTKTIVIVPPSLLENWEREAKWAGLKIDCHSWARMPKVPTTPFFLIADEAALYQSLSARRTQKMLILAESENCKGALMLTGTPSRGGRPANMYPLLRAVRHPLGKDQDRFESQYCAAETRTVWTAQGKRTVYDATGLSMPDELKRKTADVILRRLKTECLDLPPLTRVMKPVDLSEKAQAVYDKTFRELQQRYWARLDEGRIQEGGEELILLGQLRQANSIAKVESGIEFAEECLEQGGCPIIFTEFVQSAELLAKHFRGLRLGTELLTGQSTDRQAMVDRFQSGKSNVFVGTIKAGGVGLTLTRSNTVILLDRSWMIDDCSQCEARAHRAGVKWPVTSLWIQAGQIDRRIDARLMEQSKRLEQIALGQPVTVRIQSARDLAKEVAREVFRK